MTAAVCQRCGGPLPPKRGTGGRQQKWCSELCRARARHSGKTRRKSRTTGQPVDLEPVVMLDIQPFRRWLRHEISRYGLERLARTLEVNDMLIFAWLRDRERIQLDTVDRALSREGGTHLVELYPHLYNDARVAA